jgi:TolB protein
MDVDGSDVRRLTTWSGSYAWLRLSPDRLRLAFTSDEAGCIDLFVMELEDFTTTQLTGVAGFERCNVDPYWSPDGNRLAFSSSREPSLGWDAFIVSAGGGPGLNVSDNPSTDFANNIDRAMGWSPDGRIVLHTNRDGRYRTFLVPTSGAGAEPLFESVDYVYPTWSPDGDRLVASLDLEDERDVYLMNGDGSGAINLTDHPAFDALPATSNPWSPDGSGIILSSQRSGNQDLFLAHADATVLVNLTDHPDADRFMSWSPDGTRILFTSNRTGDWELYVMELDGSGVTNLTNTPGADDGRGAVWVPRG